MAHSTSPQAEWFGDRAFCKELTSCLLASNGSLLFPRRPFSNQYPESAGQRTQAMFLDDETQFRSY
jgi:hypothetical protein